MKVREWTAAALHGMYKYHKTVKARPQLYRTADMATHCTVTGQGGLLHDASNGDLSLYYITGTQMELTSILCGSWKLWI